MDEGTLMFGSIFHNPWKKSVQSENQNLFLWMPKTDFTAGFKC